MNQPNNEKPMEISGEMIRYLEELSKVSIGKEREEHFAHDLEEILGYMEILNEADTTGIEPMSHAFLNADRYREDICTPYTDIKALIDAAPQSKNNCYKVPKTVE
jgi:aspartyl-tRNA(Asn)/glutamyl-tRNA(Gln) amidotransferase subunit C